MPAYNTAIMRKEELENNFKTAVFEIWGNAAQTVLTILKATYQAELI